MQVVVLKRYMKTSVSKTASYLAMKQNHFVQFSPSQHLSINKDYYETKHTNETAYIKRLTFLQKTNNLFFVIKHHFRNCFWTAIVTSRYQSQNDRSKRIFRNKFYVFCIRTNWAFCEFLYKRFCHWYLRFESPRRPNLFMKSFINGRGHTRSSED